MKRKIDKRRIELQKIIELKEDVLQAEIVSLQQQENDLENKASFQRHVSREWLTAGVFIHSEDITQNLQSVQIEIEQIKLEKSNTQREKLSLKMAREALAKS